MITQVRYGKILLSCLQRAWGLVTSFLAVYLSNKKKQQKNLFTWTSQNNENDVVNIATFQIPYLGSSAGFVSQGKTAECKHFHLLGDDIDYHLVLKFSDRYVSANSVDPDPRGASSLIRVYTVCYSVYIFWTHFTVVKPCSNFRMITANFSGVRIFGSFTIKGDKTVVKWEWDILFSGHDLIKANANLLQTSCVALIKFLSCFMFKIQAFHAVCVLVYKLFIALFPVNHWLLAFIEAYQCGYWNFSRVQTSRRYMIN